MVNREIKFRGKRVDNGEWVYGGIYTSENEIWIFTHAWKTTMAGRIIDHTAQAFKVIPETVGQFTGCYDKNGNEIWEDDIIQYQKTKEWGFHYAGGKYENDDVQTFKGMIDFQNGGFRINKNFDYPGISYLSQICIRWKEELSKYILDHCQIHRERIGGYNNAFYSNFEIVGNIHDNLELLAAQGEKR